MVYIYAQNSFFADGNSWLNRLCSTRADAGNCLRLWRDGSGKTDAHAGDADYAGDAGAINNKHRSQQLASFSA
jgi:hypothetical protein